MEYKAQGGSPARRRADEALAVADRFLHFHCGEKGGRLVLLLTTVIAVIVVANNIKCSCCCCY
jgi:hypothetical protein